MNLTELIKALQKLDGYGDGHRYDVRVKDQDGNTYSIEDVESDEDGLFILVEV